MPRRSQKKQTRLAFAPAAASPTDETSEDVNDRFARLSYGHPSLAAVRPESFGKSKSEEPKKRSSNTSKLSKSSTRRQSPDRSAEGPAEEQSMLAHPRFVVEIPSISHLAKAHLSKQEVDEETSDDDVIVPSSHRKRRAPAEPEAIITSPAHTSKTRSTRKPKRKVTSNRDAPPDDSVEEIPRPRRRLKRKAESSPVVLSDSEDSEGPVLSSPVKRRRRAAEPETPQTPQDNADQDQLDIEEDLKDLQDSGTADRFAEWLI